MPDEREPPAPTDARFKVLYEKYYDYIVACLVGMRFSRDEARELAQEAFVRVYRSMETFRGVTEAAAVAFLKMTARNVGLNEIRRRQAVPEAQAAPEVEEVVFDPSPSPEDELAEHETTARRRKWLRETIQRLPDRDRTCLLLWLSGSPYRQISGALRMTESAVKSLLRDIRKRLRKMLGEEPTGIDWPEEDRDRES